MLWTNEYLSRLALEAETEIALKTNCIVDRISIETTQFLSEYQLPDFVYNVRKVYWKGFRLSPISGLALANIGYDILNYLEGAFNPQAFTPSYLLGSLEITSSIGAGAKGDRPYEYFYSKFGENFIKLNPGADEALSKYDSDLWNQNTLTKSLVVEFYRFPDGVTWKIPQYIRRRTIKAYVLAKAFAREGDGQNLQASQYWSNRYRILLARALKIIEGVNQAQVRTRGGVIHGGCIYRDHDYGYQPGKVVARPVLPSNYGIVVDDWD